MERKFSIQFEFESCENYTAIRKKYQQCPGSADLIRRYANCLAQNKQYLQASQLFLKAANLNSKNDCESYFRAGVCLLLRNQFVSAIKCFTEALNIYNEHYLLHSFMGIAFFYLGLIGKANVHWWTAYQINKTEFIINIVNNYFSNEYHPERLALYPICKGKGIDIGCGNRKTHPGSIGIDLTPRGSKGKVGNVAGKESVADIVSSGDNLWMFKNSELDYVVQRHNLEHYQDYIKALQEWKRIMKYGGLIGMVIPDDENCDTIHLDPTHKHVFTQGSIRRVIGLIEGLKIVYMQELLKNWSFICILQKTEGGQGSELIDFDYEKINNEFEYAQLQKQAEVYAEKGEYEFLEQCKEYIQYLKHRNGVIDI